MEVIMTSSTTNQRPRSVSARIGRGPRASWNTTIPLKTAQVHPSESRGYIVDSNFMIPRVRDLESEFQRELGKCLFERTVQFAEEGAMSGSIPTQADVNNNNNNLKSRTNRSVSVDDLSSFSAGGSANRESMRFFDSRRYLNVKPTRCTSALVQQNERFDTYFVRGSLNKYAVAHAMGPLTSPHPPIEKDVHRMHVASKDNLRPFSVREAFTDKEKEEAPGEYWKQKAIDEKERLEAEEKARIEAEEQERIEAIEREKREREEEKARLIVEEKARKEAEELLAFARAESEAIKAQLNEVEKARDEALTKLETLSTMSTSGKGKKGKGKSKGKGKGKKGKGGGSDAMSDVSGSSRKRAGKTILKSSETDDNSSTTGGKKVSFNKKLTSTKTISPRERTKSPKRSSSGGGKNNNFPGSARSKSGNAKVKGKKKKKKKKSPEPPAEAPPTPEPVKEEEPPPVEDITKKLPKKPKPIILDEPPMFCLATDYKTRQQMVEEWLYVRSCSACPTSMPLA